MCPSPFPGVFGIFGIYYSGLISPVQRPIPAVKLLVTVFFINKEYDAQARLANC